MPVSKGSKLGPYEVLAPLGAGGMGEVWRARDPRLQREVAIKVLPDETSKDPDRVARFRAEARAASALNHPNIVTVYDIGEEDGQTYLSMELLEGMGLRHLLDKERLPLSKALQVSSQIAEGLAAAHAKGIVHRDLKPENVMLTSDDVVKILDFGLAKVSPLAPQSADDETVSMTPPTAPGTLLGTVGYMSPEQAAGNVADFRSDQFSFGTILYELVCGRRAWRKPTPAETIVAILREDAPPLPSGVSVPSEVRHVIARCLAKSPDDRYGATRDLARDLKYLAEQFSDARGLSGGEPAVLEADTALLTPAPPATRRPFPRAAVLALAIAAAATGAAIIARVRRGGPEAIDSLAVLPFENGSRDPDSDYLSDGIAESLIDQMSRVPTLKVMARATVLHYKGTPDPLEAGRKLGVGAVVTGRVLRQNDRVSVAAELVDVRTGARLWGDRYDRPAHELLSVQDRIAADISAGLRLRLTEPQKRVLSGHGTDSTEAYDLFLKGRHAFYKDTEDGYLEAIELFRQAFAKDPKFTEAYSWSANIWGMMAVDGYAPPAEAFGRQEENAHQALALSPRLPLARMALASRRFWFDWDWVGAEREFRETIAMGGYVDTRILALLLWSRGRTDEAVEVMQAARRSDPGNVTVTITTADYLKKAGRLDESAALYRKAMEEEPSDPRAFFGLAETQRRQADVAGAIESLRRAYQLNDETVGVQALAEARTERDIVAAQERVAHERLADLEILAKQRYVSPLELARLAAQAGEREKAFAELEKALAERSSGLVFLKVDDAWDRVRDDPRFSALVKQIGIP